MNERQGNQGTSKGTGQGRQGGQNQNDPTSPRSSNDPQYPERTGDRERTTTNEPGQERAGEDRNNPTQGSNQGSNQGNRESGRSGSNQGSREGSRSGTEA